MREPDWNSAREITNGNFPEKDPERSALFQPPSKAALIGGGKSCNDFLSLAKKNGLLQLNMEIVGVSDPDPESPEIALAGEMGLFTTADFTELYSLPGLTLLIVFIDSREFCERIIRTKPELVGFMDAQGAKILWDLIRISEHKLHLFLESARDVICMKDPEGRYLYLNPAASSLMENTCDEILGKSDYDLFPEPIARAITAHDKQTLSAGRTMFFYERMPVNDKIRHFHTLRFPILNDSGKITSFATVSRDMTESVMLLDEIRRHKEYMENILANSSDMIITTDLEGRTVTFNPAAEKMLGYRRDEVIGVNIERLWKDPEERRKLMEEVKRVGSVSNYPASLIARDGHEVEVSLSLSELRDSDGYLLGTVGISKDGTEENQLRRRILQHEAELIAATDFLNKILQSSPNAVMATDMQGNILIWNKAAEDTLGYNAKDVIGKMNIERIYPEGVARKVMKLMRSPDHDEAGKLRSYPITYVRRDGRTIEGRLSSAIIYDGTGKEVASVGIFSEL